MNTHSDAEMIEASWENPRQFEVLFDRHYEAIRSFLARRVGLDLADDLAANVFLVAFESRAKYRTERPNARPWLYGIATNLLRRHFRTEQRRLRAISRLGVGGPQLFDEDEAVSRADATRMSSDLAAALLKMSRRNRDVLILIAWEELSQKETAEVLGIRVGTVRTRLHHARRQLRDTFGSSGQYLSRTTADISTLPADRKAEA